MTKKEKTGFFDQDIEWKVSIFTTLLVIAMFVTVAIYIYAGDQQNLPTRNFGAVDIKKTLKIGQQTFNKSDVVTLSDGETIGPVDGTNKIFVIEPSGGGETLVLPSGNTLDDINQLTSGYTLKFLVLNNSSTQSVTVTSDDSRVTFLNGNSVTIAAATSREILIRKLADDNYQVIMF